MKHLLDSLSSSGNTIWNGVMAEMGKNTEGGGHNLVKSQRKGQTIIKCIGRSCFCLYLFCAPLLLLFETWKRTKLVYSLGFFLTTTIKCPVVLQVHGQCSCKPFLRVVDYDSAPYSFSILRYLYALRLRSPSRSSSFTSSNKQSIFVTAMNRRIHFFWDVMLFALD